MNCYHCQRNKFVSTHTLKWLCTPDEDEMKQDYWSIIDVNLCENCWSVVKPGGPCYIDYVTGWDKYNALDELERINLYQEYGLVGVRVNEEIEKTKARLNYY